MCKLPISVLILSWCLLVPVCPSPARHTYPRAADFVPVPKREVKVRVEKSSSSLDLNDPVVMDDLLKQLKQRMKDQGLNGDIKLSWKKQSDGKVFHKEEKKTNKKRRYEL